MSERYTLMDIEVRNVPFLFSHKRSTLPHYLCPSKYTLTETKVHYRTIRVQKSILFSKNDSSIALKMPGRILPGGFGIYMAQLK